MGVRGDGATACTQRQSEEMKHRPLLDDFTFALHDILMVEGIRAALEGPVILCTDCTIPRGVI